MSSLDEQIKGIASALTVWPIASMTPAVMRSNAIMDEYRAMGIEDSHAVDLYHIGLTPDVLWGLSRGYPEIVPALSYEGLPKVIYSRYGIFKSERRKLEIPKPKRRKNRMRIE